GRRARPRGVRAALPPLHPLGDGARPAAPTRPRPRRGRGAGDLRRRLALRRELQARARPRGAVALCRRPKRDHRPDAHAQRACGRGAGHPFRRARAARARRDLVRVVARPSRPGRAAGEGARSRGAGLLERDVAERGRRVPRHPPRHRQDPDPERPLAARRAPRGRGAPVTPRFDDLVEQDLPAEERGRLERVHDLLVAAGPPPELSPEFEFGPTLAMTLPKRRQGRGRQRLAPGALASLVLSNEDDAGNWPMKLTVTGLAKLPPRGYYEVFLARDGRPIA